MTIDSLEDRLRSACHAVIPHLADDTEPTDLELDTAGPVVLHRHGDRRRPNGSRVVAIAAVVAIVVGAALAFSLLRRSSVQSPTHGSTTPTGDVASTQIGSTSTTGAGPSLACDDHGCHGFDPLPVVAGASDYYVGADSLGTPHVDLGMFDSLTRCAALDAAGTACAKLEGIAGLNLVAYPPADSATINTDNRTEGSYSIQIGTTFTDADPLLYANDWTPANSGGGLADVTVRGHPGIRADNSVSGISVVWQERPGVLVWVIVPPDDADQLLQVAEGVHAVSGPTTIPDRLAVGDGNWQAQNNDGIGIVVGTVGGVECFGYRNVDTCGQTINDRTKLLHDDAGFTIAGTTPPAVHAVRVTLEDGTVDTIPTTAIIGRTSRYFQRAVTSGAAASLEWVDEHDTVVDTLTIIRPEVAGTTPANAGTSTTVTETAGPTIGGVTIINASGNAGLAGAVAEYLRNNGIGINAILQTTQRIDHTLLQPISPDLTIATALNAYLGLGGFDTFTPSLINNIALPTGTTVVITIGTDGGPPTYLTTPHA